MGIGIHIDPVGNGRKGGLQRAENERKKNLWLFGDGKRDFDEYKKKMMKLQKGVELTKEELLWMEKVEKNLEFHIPKLARQEVKAEVEHNINSLGFIERTNDK